MKSIGLFTGGVVLTLALFGGNTAIVHGAEQQAAKPKPAPVVARATPAPGDVGWRERCQVLQRARA